MPQPAAPTPSGLLLIDKPIGPTSMNICANLRWRLRQGGAPKGIKVGHSGTLDPLATGLLVILVGKATPLSDTIMKGEKDYTASIDLSAFTTTDDAEGERTPVDVAAPPTPEQIAAACASFVGEIQQTPPAFSAIKINGQRAYRVARKHGAEAADVQLKPRPVTISAIGIDAYAWPLLTIRITCGKGTYIRSLARDLGRALGTGGTLTALRRTRIGRFSIDHAKRPAELPERLTQADLLPPPAPG